jgi:hypothetical protein
MPFKRSLQGITLVSLLVAGCDSVTPASSTGPIALTPGTVEYQLRQQQLQNARSGANPGIQNPAVTNVNPSVDGIERAETGGTGSTGGAIGGMRSDGTVVRPGGAPATQTTVPANPRRPAPAY